MTKLYLLSAFTFAVFLSVASCTEKESDWMTHEQYYPTGDELIVSRADYQNKLHGFWLGQCIANWTGLVTEMDKIGNIGDIKTGNFYTRDDWGKPDQPSIWAEGIPSALSPTIDFVFEDSLGVWGADDDTDIEYIYQHLMYENQSVLLTGEQIKDGWLKHIKAEEENYLWVSNQTAFDLMNDGLIPPATGDPENNPDFEMIDAQLTTEIFGLFSPLRPDFALEMSLLPIQNTARFEAQEIAEFYVIMYSLASNVDPDESISDQIFANAAIARDHLTEGSYPAAMYDFVQQQYEYGFTWEEARDDLYQRFQVDQRAGYDLTSRNLYCNGCFAAGINFGASLISLFYGEGDILETIKIGSLAGWDSDNPTATWGGMLGFILGEDGVEKAFDREFSDVFFIHRTRQGFPNDGYDDFNNMALKGLLITDKVVQEHLSGGIDLEKDLWYIPKLNE
jgi:hypothetical protein